MALVAAGSGEYIARAGPTTTEHDAKVIGVAVGPLRDAENGYVSDAVGQAIQVLTFGKGKCKVDGTDNIAVGDALVSHDTDGEAMLMAADVDLPTGDSTTYWTATIEAAAEADIAGIVAAAMAGFAIALYASTVDGDIIPIHVHGARGTLT